MCSSSCDLRNIYIYIYVCIYYLQVNDDEENVLFKWSRCEYTASSDTQDGNNIYIYIYIYIYIIYIYIYIYIHIHISEYTASSDTQDVIIFQ